MFSHFRFPDALPHAATLTQTSSCVLKTDLSHLVFSIRLLPEQTVHTHGDTNIMTGDSPLPPQQVPVTPISRPSSGLSIRIVRPGLQPATPAVSSPISAKEKGKSSKKAKSPPVKWDDDKDPNGLCSLDYLIAWLERPHNVDRWRNGYQGKKPKDVMRECSEWLKNEGCPTLRDPVSCENKIRVLYNEWRDAYSFKNETGNGSGGEMLRNAENTGLEDAVNKAITAVERLSSFLILRFEISNLTGRVHAICPLWDTLNPIFRDRDAGNAALRADTTSAFNPILETLRSSLSGSDSWSTFPQDSPSTLNDAIEMLDSEDNGEETRSSTFLGSSGTSTGATPQTTVKTSHTVIEGHSISDRSQKKRKGTHAVIEDQFKVEIFKRDEEYRQAKLEKMTEKNKLKQDELRTHSIQAMFASAKMIQEVNPTQSWFECKREAALALGLPASAAGSGDV
ncbi:hypothetical protein TREMEDRAFT_66316 [Tremella mesenterica DSM 1558]|uniref:uncharacterized protein n=1 Tax=Tremella mesenterica (strain ATCC 24925 / CBS 8224 / DSM 1558 / NBRC 9311 / NRRL Y-6157 / RJB 2259-6 / UBC 559-6) TaxID=578456 RepID=UPI00032CB957|nr:uncharacterized protein TREMEDRAFT_66316 [Tremella mesenterica DSM 1558]EIW65718.1 hypothetical protein TREMEDRAFT_66316 [Tremella mesenterica DSM 1558]